MKRQVILDAGPIIALLNKYDQFHAWAHAQFSRFGPPALTCEAVITEAWHVLRHYPMGQRSILKLLGQGSIEIRFTLMAEIAAIIKLTARYANVPMSVADACLVRMAEIYSGSAVATLDSDFAIYRKQGRQVIPLITPFKR